VRVAESNRQPDKDCLPGLPVDSHVRKDIIIKIDGKDTYRYCTTADGIAFEGWPLASQFLMRLYSPLDSVIPLENLYLVEADTGTAWELGAEIESHSSLSFFRNNTAAVRISVMDFSPNESEPHECTLSIIDFKTQNITDVDPTFCYPAPQIHLNESSHQLFYLNYQLKPQVTTLHFIDLDAQIVIPLDMTGTIVDIADIAPDWKQVALIVDDDKRAFNDFYTGERSYSDPRWVVFDVQNNQTIYQKHLLETQQTSSFSDLAYEGIGTAGMQWTANGWHTLLFTDDKTQPPLLIQSIEGHVTETQLKNLPHSDQLYKVVWSADGQYGAAVSNDNAVYVIDTIDASVIQISRPLELNDARLVVNWSGNTTQLIMEISQRGAPVTLARWLIDPFR
jgi:hypothetical protein